jgi:hypothetical protein
MTVHVKPDLTSPLAVSDPKIRKMLQLAGLRFVCSRARWLEDEARRIGIALKSGAMTSDEADEKLAEMGLLDLCYPEFMADAAISNEITLIDAPALRDDSRLTAPRYRTPPCTVDAFFYVVRLGDAPRLAAWLEDHPRDKEFLLNLLKDRKNGRP